MPEKQYSIGASLLISLGALVFALIPLILPSLDPAISPFLAKLFLISSIIMGIGTVASSFLRLKYTLFNRLSQSLFLILVMYTFFLFGIFPFSITSLALILLAAFL